LFVQDLFLYIEIIWNRVISLAFFNFRGVTNAFRSTVTVIQWKNTSDLYNTFSMTCFTGRSSQEKENTKLKYLTAVLVV